jgi:DNA-binding MarR family transcriptional regulator
MTPGNSDAPARLTGKPTWLISQVSTHGHRLLADRLAAAGARGYHYRLLAALQEFGPASQASLGRRTSMDRSDVVAALNDLTSHGHAQRTPDPADHRRNVITITPAGTAHLERLDGLLAEVQDELLAPLSPGERGQLSRLLGRVLEHHTPAGLRPQTGAFARVTVRYGSRVRDWAHSRETAAAPTSIVRAAPSAVGSASSTSRWTPAWANSAASSGVSRPRGVTLISSSPSPAGRGTRSAAAASPVSEATACSGVSQ